MVSKRADRPYRGGRSKDWIKVKNRKHPAMAAGDGQVAPTMFGCPIYGTTHELSIDERAEAETSATANLWLTFRSARRMRHD